MRRIALRESSARPATMRIDVHGALESLEMGLLPIRPFDGRVGVSGFTDSPRLSEATESIPDNTFD